MNAGQPAQRGLASIVYAHATACSTQTAHEHDGRVINHSHSNDAGKELLVQTAEWHSSLLHRLGLGYSGNASALSGGLCGGVGRTYCASPPSLNRPAASCMIARAI